VPGGGEHDGAGHLDLAHGDLPPVTGPLVATVEGQRQPVQPPLGEYLDGAWLQRIADLLQGGRVVAGGEAVGQLGEPDPRPLRLPLGPLMAVEPDLGRVGEVGADLDERRAEALIPQGVGRPSARCLRAQVLFRRPPTRTGRAGFPRITALR
jgi:hypothetical protein